MDDIALTVGETSTVTIDFSEAVAGFALGDLDSPNGTLSGLSTSNNITWTALFTPAANIADETNSITLAAASYTDVAGNAGAAAIGPNYTVDTVI